MSEQDYGPRRAGHSAKEKEENIGEELAGCKGLRAEWVMGLGGAQDSLALFSLSLTHASFSGKTKKRKREARVFSMHTYIYISINSAELMTVLERKS